MDITPEQRHAANVIRTRGAAEFYHLKSWVRLAARVREAQNNECQSCKARGLYSPAEAVHHINPVLSAPELSLDFSNLVCLCARCHNDQHGRGHDAAVTVERW